MQYNENMQQEKNGNHKKGKFELWRDRTFSVIVPFFFGYILLTQAHNNTIRIILIVMLLGFASGEVALFSRHMLRVLGRILGNGNNTENDNLSKDRKIEKNNDNEKDGKQRK